jgi:hypothetical protein
LNKIEYDKEEVFLSGIRFVQMEPRWGGEEDAAAQLRGSAAFGLVRTAAGWAGWASRGPCRRARLRLAGRYRPQVRARPSSSRPASRQSAATPCQPGWARALLGPGPSHRTRVRGY